MNPEPIIILVLVVVAALIGILLANNQPRHRSTFWEEHASGYVEKCPYCGFGFGGMSQMSSGLGGTVSGSSESHFEINDHAVCPSCGSKIRRTPRGEAMSRRFG